MGLLESSCQCLALWTRGVSTSIQEAECLGFAFVLLWFCRSYIPEGDKGRPEFTPVGAGIASTLVVSDRRGVDTSFGCHAIDTGISQLGGTGQCQLVVVK